MCALLIFFGGEDRAWLVVVPPAWFIVFFVIVFVLGYAFPSPQGHLEFPGARKIIWPIVGLLAIATALVWKMKR